MQKYRKIPDIILVEIYKLGMEDGWTIEYSGFYSYCKEFKTRQECLDFIKNDEGKLDCYSEDRELDIIYEDPMPFIKTTETEYDVKEGDYIIVDDKGKKLRVVKKDIFEKTYELIDK